MCFCCPFIHIKRDNPTVNYRSNIRYCYQWCFSFLLYIITYFYQTTIKCKYIMTQLWLKSRYEVSVDSINCHRYNHTNIRQSECNEWFNVTDVIWYLFAESAWLNGLVGVFQNWIFSLHPYCFPYSQTWLYPAVISASLILIYHGSNWLIIAPRGRKYVLWSLNFFPS